MICLPFRRLVRQAVWVASLFLLGAGVALASGPGNREAALRGVQAAGNAGFQPMGIELGTFGARPGTNSVVLRWETSYEVNRVGFNLYRTTRLARSMVRVNEDLIPSLVSPGSVAGASYEYVDTMVPRPGVYYYWLELVGTDGDDELFGPIVAAVNGGKTLLRAEGVDAGLRR